MKHVRLGRTGLHVSRLCLGTMTFGLQCDEERSRAILVVRAGKVRYVGVSNYLAYQLARAIGRSETLNLVRFDSAQPRHSLLFREVERELFPLCQEEGVGVIPYNPLAGGLLSGKHDRTKPPADGSRFTLGTAADRYQQRYWQERMFDTIDELAAVAADLGVTLPTLAVAWSLSQPAIIAPIIGASRPEQLDATLAAVDLHLDDATRERLDKITIEYRRGDAGI